MASASVRAPKHLHAFDVLELALGGDDHRGGARVVAPLEPGASARRRAAARPRDPPRPSTARVRGTEKSEGRRRDRQGQGRRRRPARWRVVPRPWRRRRPNRWCRRRSAPRAPRAAAKPLGGHLVRDPPRRPGAGRDQRLHLHEERSRTVVGHGEDDAGHFESRPAQRRVRRRGVHAVPRSPSRAAPPRPWARSGVSALEGGAVCRDDRPRCERPVSTRCSSARGPASSPSLVT